jgi:hypothetical protein
MLKTSSIVAAAIAALVLPAASHAQSRGTDSRLYPFLGCWRSDTTGAKSAASSALTCVVPVEGSPDVEMVSIVDDHVSSRRRIDASARTHPIDGQGCSGQERTSWSTLERRVYLRAEYVCSPSGIAGGSTTLFSFLPNGDMLEVESVRSGNGTIVRAERRRDVGVPNNLPREIAGRIGNQRLAVVTARAEAAAPITLDDVRETLRMTDTAVVRAWLLETAQHFQLTGEQVATLVRDNVPSSVLQAMMAVPPKYQLGMGVDANGRSTDAYLSTPVMTNAAPVVQQVYVEPCCYPVYSSYVYYNPVQVVQPPPYPRAYTSSRYYAPYTYYSSYPYATAYPNRSTYGGPATTTHREPSYLTSPVGVRASTPTAVPSRRR